MDVLFQYISLVMVKTKLFTTDTRNMDPKGSGKIKEILCIIIDWKT